MLFVNALSVLAHLLSFKAERRKFVGNLVNPVSFAEWRRKFDAEMAAAKAATAGPEDKRKRLTGTHFRTLMCRLTPPRVGRQMFESDAALSKSDQVADGTFFLLLVFLDGA